jgi:predicted transglutaminase-like cysteine proteinase
MKHAVGLMRILALITVLVASFAVAVDFDRLLSGMQQRFGQAGIQSLRDWHKLQNEAGQLSPAEKLKRVNEFFNRHVRFGDDQQIWGQSDYWATPLETLGKGAGDCEDFTIAKYFTLLNLGVPNEQLRLIYVKARIGGMNSSLVQAHMVLAYYPAPDAEPLVLDNLITEIRPAARRPDLVPVFSFNSQGVWQGAAEGGAQGSGGVGSLSRWQNLLHRARAEGFE